MKRSKFSDSHIFDAVKRPEFGISVPDICRELGVSSATFYKWRYQVYFYILKTYSF